MKIITRSEGVYEYVEVEGKVKAQLCIICKSPIGIVPGTRDAHCLNCGYKDPCCE